jgi:uncharacterized Zn finger protein
MPDSNVDAVCPVCGAEFSTEELLRDHGEMHRNRCPTCGSEFTTEALLAAHERTHAASPAEEAAILEEQGERKP